jgi:hypothetical protein
MGAWVKVSDEPLRGRRGSIAVYMERSPTTAIEPNR